MRSTAHLSPSQTARCRESEQERERERERALRMRTSCATARAPAWVRRAAAVPLVAMKQIFVRHKKRCTTHLFALVTRRSHSGRQSLPNSAAKSAMRVLPSSLQSETGASWPFRRLALAPPLRLAPLLLPGTHLELRGSLGQARERWMEQGACLFNRAQIGRHGAEISPPLAYAEWQGRLVATR